jgi:hypothetical protein
MLWAIFAFLSLVGMWASFLAGVVIVWKKRHGLRHLRVRPLPRFSEVKDFAFLVVKNRSDSFQLHQRKRKEGAERAPLLDEEEAGESLLPEPDEFEP